MLYNLGCNTIFSFIFKVLFEFIKKLKVVFISMKYLYVILILIYDLYVCSTKTYKYYYFVAKCFKSCHQEVDLIIVPSESPRLGSGTIHNIKNTEMIPKIGVILKAHCQVPAAAPICDPIM